MKYFFTAFNRIQHIEDSVFGTQKFLRYLGLSKNSCIDQKFHRSSEFTEMAGIVATKCSHGVGFQFNTSSIDQLFFLQRQQLKSIELFLNQTLAQNKQCSLEVKRLQTKNMETELNNQCQINLLEKEAEIVDLKNQLELNKAKLKTAKETIDRL